ncbi:MchC protein [Raoultella sp. T31]|uniref:MchC protein n=1 Tax=Raoultella sp. T31 TaxID=2054594 RepID=UPI000C2850DD|nr:MchC protein [Raoultella sp. T31]
MNQQCSLAELNENLVPFTARRVTSSLIWCAEDALNIEALQKACSYIIDPVSSTHSKIFHAERYGGSGIQRNGGGARCGFDSNYQVKGMGANPLVGDGTDGRHSNGALGAIHAIYEALWGEVLAQILPYGAVRARAVLLTDVYTDKAFDRSHGKSRRALLVREPAVRPAHFERAPYFRPQQEYADRLIHDARRVRSVIRMLPGNLPVPAEGVSEEARHNPRLYCIEGLCELAHREAWQMAFCRTRFLRLTTSPSNIAMDGRLMDFNGLSCLFPGDYPDNFGHQLRLTELVKEPMVLMQGLSDLCLYLGKYLFEPDFTLVARQKVEETFQKTFREACYYCYLEQLGIPAEFIPQEGIPETLKQLVNSFVVLVNKHSGRLYRPDAGSKDDSPLQRLVVELIRRSQNPIRLADNNDKRDVHFTEAQHCFTRAIHWLTQVGIRRPINASSLRKEMENHTRKRLQPRKGLGKAYMSEKIAALLDKHGDDHQFLQEAFSDMETRMKAFSREAFGHVNPIRIAE